MASQRRWKIAGINFDHFHMGDLLRYAAEHPQAEIVGVYDQQPERVHPVLQALGLSASLLYDDDQQLLDQAKPDIVILCPAAADHASWFQRVARPGLSVLVEKPFASSLADAQSMIRYARATNCTLAVNWPLAWVATHRTAYRLAVIEQRIGELISVNYYGGNRGPLWHTFDKIEITADIVAREKPKSWFYKRASGGGSLLDYLGYGATLGTWFHQGRAPLEVTCMVDQPAGLEVDEHSIAVCRYSQGLSRYETRWGTFTDPWTHQTQPACGFTLIGSAGTIQSSDYLDYVTLQDRDHPSCIRVALDTFSPEESNPIGYMIDRLTRQLPIEGPLSLQTGWTGQRIVDTAYQSAIEQRTLKLLGTEEA